MKRRYITGLVLILILFLIFKIFDRDSGDQNFDETDISNTVQNVNKKELEVKPQDLIIFVPNEMKTIIEERHITLNNAENKTTEELLVDALKVDPNSDNAYVRPIPADININKVEKKGKTVVVDFSKKGLKNDPATESLILDCLVLTMTTLKGVEEVQIMIDGKIEDSFMGTFNVREPLTISSVTNNVNYLDTEESSDENPVNQNTDNTQEQNTGAEDNSAADNNDVNNSNQDANSATDDNSGTGNTDSENNTDSSGN